MSLSESRKDHTPVGCELYKLDKFILQAKYLQRPQIDSTENFPAQCNEQIHNAGRGVEKLVSEKEADTNKPQV